MSYEENDLYYDDFAQSQASDESQNPEAENDCESCGKSAFGRYCDDCNWDMNDPHNRGDIDFADPSGVSALRAASPSNPRNLPCPTCEIPNLLTPADVARRYQCDSCADSLERGY